MKKFELEGEEGKDNGCKYFLWCEHCGFEKCVYDKNAYSPTLLRLFLDELVGYLYEKGATPYLIGVALRWSRKSIWRSMKRYLESKRQRGRNE